MRRLHTDDRRSRTATARLPAVPAPRPYLEAKAFTTRAASRIRNNFADHRRVKSSSTVAPRDVDELLAVFHDKGGHIELRRQIPAGEPLFSAGRGCWMTSLL